MNQLPARAFLLLVALFCTNICFSQTLTQIVNYHLQKAPQEKIFIHYDKNSYVTGDTVWFKAYVYSGSGRSKTGRNFYMEFLDEKGKVVNRLTAPILESTASGNMVLPADSSATAIYCRAYTEAMLKADSSLIYLKPLSIINLKKSAATAASANNIRFLPEGGNWIENVPALLAFKVTNAEGLPLEATGIIKNGTETVAEFATAHDGMGFVAMSPLAGQTYTAVWKDAAGTDHNTPLPKALPNGVGLHIEDVAAGKKFYMFRSKAAADDDKQLTLVAHTNGGIAFQVDIDMSVKEMVNGIMPVKELPTGILYITVFNKKMKPVAERITFVNNHDYSFNVDTAMTTITKVKRGKNEIKLALKDTIRSNFSLSVTDADFDQPSASRDNIISSLLLTGDLRGKIVNPYYYFKNNTPGAAKNLDLVMLTHGWRKYNWSSDTTSQSPEDTVRANSFLSIKGKIRNPPASLPASYANVIVQTGDTTNIMLPLTINKEGYFFRDGLIYYGDAKMYFKFVNKSLASNGTKLDVSNGLITKFNFPFSKPSPDTASLVANPAVLPGRVEDYLAELKRTRALKEVLIKSSKLTERNKLENTYTSGVFKDGISTTIKVGDDPRFLNYASLFQYLQGKVAGLSIRNPLGNPLTTPTATWRNESVYFFLNGFQVTVDDISSTSMNDFDYVKIYDPSMGGTFGAPGGVISVYTKKGKGFVYDGKNNKMFIIPGYTAVKEFFSPDYATGIMVSKPDLRTTLYWNPNIILDKANPQQVIKFYNNDVTRKFKIVLQGMNFDGKLVYMEKVL